MRYLFAIGIVMLALVCGLGQILTNEIDRAKARNLDAQTRVYSQKEAQRLADEQRWSDLAYTERSQLSQRIVGLERSLLGLLEIMAWVIGLSAATGLAVLILGRTGIHLARVQAEARLYEINERTGLPPMVFDRLFSPKYVALPSVGSVLDLGKSKEANPHQVAEIGRQSTAMVIAERTDGKGQAPPVIKG